MRALLFFALLLASLIRTHADFKIATFEKKVADSEAILRVSVREVAPPKTKRPQDAAVCKAKVLEVLKGPADVKEVEFRFHAYGSFSSDKLPQMIGKEYYIFLSEGFGPGRPPNQRWVFEGPAGIRPIAEEYKEYRLVDGKITRETLSRSNFISSIRELVSHPLKKEEAKKNELG